jgi:mono/diheme cytochrome c family protein
MRSFKVVGWATVGIVAISVVWVVLQIRAHGFSARETPTSYEALIARQLRRLATESDARSLRNPIEATPLAIAEARDHFADHCATCHGNVGDGKTQINSGLYPPAPDMRLAQTQDLSDGELFYLIKNGVRFTGMPGWGGGDEDNWKLVLFIRHLSQVTPMELEFMSEINHLPADSDAGH